MSAIKTFGFQNLMLIPRTCCASRCVFAEETVRQTQEPAVTACFAWCAAAKARTMRARCWCK